ncbi:TPA: hypothetical protein ACPZQN_001896 [Yersinia enterocolitica]
MHQIFKIKLTIKKEVMMAENKNNMVGCKLDDSQVGVLDELIKSGKAKTRSGAIQYLINLKLILE